MFNPIRLFAYLVRADPGLEMCRGAANGHVTARKEAMANESCSGVRWTLTVAYTRTGTVTAYTTIRTFFACRKVDSPRKTYNFSCALSIFTRSVQYLLYTWYQAPLYIHVEGCFVSATQDPSLRGVLELLRRRAAFSSFEACQRQTAFVRTRYTSQSEVIQHGLPSRFKDGGQIAMRSCPSYRAPRHTEPGWVSCLGECAFTLNLA